MARFLMIVWGLSYAIHLSAQEDLLSLLQEQVTTEYTSAIFKTSRIINGHSIENTPRGIVDIKISHRFGFINNGVYDFFGLDGATIRIGGDFGITDRISVGIGRSSLEKMYDTYGKIRLLKQSSGKRKIPIGVSYIGSVSINTLKFEDPEASNLFQSRLFYSHQLLIARKFNEDFSVQIMPTVVHRNLVQTHSEKHDVLAFGIGGRQKLSKRMSLNLEYYYVLPDQLAERYKNSLSLGFDIETGGHVFQLHFTNSTSMVYKGFITETVGDWLDGGIHFGFNLSRVFTYSRK
ncbi:MAG: hypothetical protein IPL46_33025 [Saprospiraceae bacterium]|nr:hypothetical protein [Saprospiraceae bacterium]